ncbi:response regulator transcription factor [Sedimenticola selenatireducens]|jgi:DNA-binding response OmpR family regulator|uniref:Response regulator n=1 Tax=Sedimenticola selenatireducens TaxID=191960 RepID=A0A557SHS4_9GAMM|nr:response regulator [Sedimenticola selenatireducens]TVO76941.1 response regulator [Sedimenticola selenatireducens]TVT64384.1 MAG: response regulator [Sedimenticola selenatireducens]
MTQHILIVDDEKNIVISIDYLLRREGFEVSVAHDGEEGLNLIKSQHPDLVLLDVMMPKLNGFQVCELVKQDPALASVRIIMLTAKGRDAEKEKGLALGADAYITKPFATRDLVAQVKALLT